MVITVTINPAVDKTYIVENFKPGDINRAQRIIYNAGSNAINVSRVLKQVNRDNTVLGFVGGRNGDILLSELASDGIKEDLIRVEGDIRLNVKIMDTVSHLITEVNEAGNPITQKEYKDFISKYKEYLQKCEAVVLSGSLLPEMNVHEYFDLVKIAKSFNKPTFLNCSGKLMNAALDASPTYIKPNYREFCDLIGKKDMSKEEIIESSIKIIEKHNIEYVIVSCSDKGSIGVSKSEIYHIIPPNIEVLSTIGAGDAYMAGLCHGYLSGFDFKTQLILATSFASAKITKEGNNIPSLVEHLGYADGCIVKKL
ncbi:MAG: 1-phosphofructokinase family hexose kinase [Clostridia bacterium]|nr:1-phosphofructokinase family hexose kinase [Clostridia bacterium]